MVVGVGTSEVASEAAGGTGEGGRVGLGVGGGGERLGEAAEEGGEVGVDCGRGVEARELHPTSKLDKHITNATAFPSAFGSVIVTWPQVLR